MVECIGLEVLLPSLRLSPSLVYGRIVSIFKQPLQIKYHAAPPHVVELLARIVRRSAKRRQEDPWASVAALARSRPETFKRVLACASVTSPL